MATYSHQSSIIGNGPSFSLKAAAAAEEEEEEDPVRVQQQQQTSSSNDNDDNNCHLQKSSHNNNNNTNDNDEFYKNPIPSSRAAKHSHFMNNKNNDGQLTMTMGPRKTHQNLKAQHLSLATVLSATYLIEIGVQIFLTLHCNSTLVPVIFNSTTTKSTTSGQTFNSNNNTLNYENSRTFWSLLILLSTMLSSFLVTLVSITWVFIGLDFAGRLCGRLLCYVMHFLHFGFLWRFLKLTFAYDHADIQEFISLRTFQIFIQSLPLTTIHLSWFLIFKTPAATTTEITTFESWSWTSDFTIWLILIEFLSIIIAIIVLSQFNSLQKQQQISDYDDDSTKKTSNPNYENSINNKIFTIFSRLNLKYILTLIIRAIFLCTRIIVLTILIINVYLWTFALLLIAHFMLTTAWFSFCIFKCRLMKKKRWYCVDKDDHDHSHRTISSVENGIEEEENVVNKNEKKKSKLSSSSSLNINNSINSISFKNEEEHQFCEKTCQDLVRKVIEFSYISFWDVFFFSPQCQNQHQQQQLNNLNHDFWNNPILKITVWIFPICLILIENCSTIIWAHHFYKESSTNMQQLVIVSTGILLVISWLLLLLLHFEKYTISKLCDVSRRNNNSVGNIINEERAEKISRNRIEVNESKEEEEAEEKDIRSKSLNMTLKNECTQRNTNNNNNNNEQSFSLNINDNNINHSNNNNDPNGTIVVVTEHQECNNNYGKRQTTTDNFKNKGNIDSILHLNDNEVKNSSSFRIWKKQFYRKTKENYNEQQISHDFNNSLRMKMKRKRHSQSSGSNNCGNFSQINKVINNHQPENNAKIISSLTEQCLTGINPHSETGSINSPSYYKDGKLCNNNNIVVKTSLTSSPFETTKVLSNSNTLNQDHRSRSCLESATVVVPWEADICCNDSNGSSTNSRNTNTMLTESGGAVESGEKSISILDEEQIDDEFRENDLEDSRRFVFYFPERHSPLLVSRTSTSTSSSVTPNRTRKLDVQNSAAHCHYNKRTLVQNQHCRSSSNSNNRKNSTSSPVDIRRYFRSSTPVEIKKASRIIMNNSPYKNNAAKKNCISNISSSSVIAVTGDHMSNSNEIKNNRNTTSESGRCTNHTDTRLHNANVEGGSCNNNSPMKSNGTGMIDPSDIESYDKLMEDSYGILICEGEMCPSSSSTGNSALAARNEKLLFQQRQSMHSHLLPSIFHVNKKIKVLCAKCLQNHDPLLTNCMSSAIQDRQEYEKNVNQIPSCSKYPVSNIYTPPSETTEYPSGTEMTWPVYEEDDEAADYDYNFEDDDDDQLSVSSSHLSNETYTTWPKSSYHPSQVHRQCQQKLSMWTTSTMLPSMNNSHTQFPKEFTSREYVRTWLLASSQALKEKQQREMLKCKRNLHKNCNCPNNHQHQMKNRKYRRNEVESPAAQKIEDLFYNSNSLDPIYKFKNRRHQQIQFLQPSSAINSTIMPHPAFPHPSLSKTNANLRYTTEIETHYQNDSQQPDNNSTHKELKGENQVIIDGNELNASVAEKEEVEVDCIKRSSSRSRRDLEIIIV